jgi:hypothetical protein
MVERPPILFYTLKKTDKILNVRVEGLFWARNKVRCSFFLWTLGLAFGSFTLWPSKSRGHGQFMAKGFDFGHDL